MNVYFIALGCKLYKLIFRNNTILFAFKITLMYIYSMFKRKNVIFAKKGIF